MAARKQIDWEGIEREYRLGQKSVRAIGSQFSVSHVAIVKKAQRENWIQDKSEEVRTKTKAALLSYQRSITKEITTPTREDIEKAVETNIAVITSHRKSIREGHVLVDILHSQLKGAADNREEIEEEIIQDTKRTSEDGKDDIKRRNSMLKAVALPSHAGVLRDLSMALKNLIPLERQAFNIPEDGTGDDSGKFSLELDNGDRLQLKAIAVQFVKGKIQDAHEPS